MLDVLNVCGIRVARTSDGRAQAVPTDDCKIEDHIELTLLQMSLKEAGQHVKHPTLFRLSGRTAVQMVRKTVSENPLCALLPPHGYPEHAHALTRCVFEQVLDWTGIMELHPFVLLFLLSAALKTRFRLLFRLEDGDHTYVLADERRLMRRSAKGRTVMRSNILHEVKLEITIPKGKTLEEIEWKVCSVVPTNRKGVALKRDTRPAEGDDCDNTYDRRSLRACYKCFREEVQVGNTILVCENNRDDCAHPCCLVCHVKCDGLEEQPAEDVRWFCPSCRLTQNVA